MRRHHDMPFGAIPLPDGRVRFRLWAPAARRVELLLDDRHGERKLPLRPVQDGWFELTTDAATVGSLYRFRIDGRHPAVPDPASRHQPNDIHGPSQVIDPGAFVWRDDSWRNRPWREAVVYELHVGSFTPQGTFAAVEQKLDLLVELGITAVELMPVADFPGQRNWGYDGVLPFAPDSRYGTPEDLKHLVQAMHQRGLMTFLDVVYNHFGPEGNYLHLYAPDFFNPRHHTPWGAAINYDGENNHWVRQFMIHNALYWINEFHFDGLRLDAVHAICDDSRPDILQELAETVAAGTNRSVHLILENDHNAARYLERRANRPLWYAAQWNDDLHHAAHVLITGERDGYYEDYADTPATRLARCLTEGFAYQGEASKHRSGAARGEPSAHLPPTAFVSFLENHDQVGNRAFGERPTTLASPDAVGAVLSVILLAPAPPLLFMGQEWGCRQPFPFFCDFGGDLARAVTEGRRREFARFPEFADPRNRNRIPDPMSESTFQQAVLQWAERNTAEGQRWLALHRELLRLRRRFIIPHLDSVPWHAESEVVRRTLHIRWQTPTGRELILWANLEAAPAQVHHTAPCAPFFTWQPPSTDDPQVLPAWSVLWFSLAGEGA